MKLNTFKEYSIFIWLIVVTLSGIFILTIYKNSRNDQLEQIKSSLNNIYLKKTIQEIRCTKNATKSLKNQHFFNYK